MISTEKTHDIAFNKNELKKLQEAALNRLLIASFHQIEDRSEEICFQLQRLDTRKPWKRKDSADQLHMTLASVGTSDTVVANEYNTTRSSLRRYRDDVIAALQFTTQNGEILNPFLDLTPRAQDSYQTLVEIHNESEAIKKKLANPLVIDLLETYPHVMGLLKSFEEFTAITPLLDDLGVPYGKPKNVNSIVRSFLFPPPISEANIRAGDNVLAIALLARKTIFAHWLQNNTDYWGNNVMARISSSAAALFSPLKRTHAAYHLYHGARRFCEIALEREFETLRSVMGYSSDFLELFPHKEGTQHREGFENVDIPAAYEVFAHYLSVPQTFIEFATSIVKGDRYRAIGKNLTRPYFAETTATHWVETGALFLENCLLTEKNLTIPVNYFPIHHLENLYKVKQLFYDD